MKFIVFSKNTYRLIRIIWNIDYYGYAETNLVE